MKFGINKFFQRQQIALTQHEAWTLLLVFENFSCAYLFQTALKIMCLHAQ